MRAKEFISEIDYAVDINPYNPDISKSKYIGTMQHRNIVLIDGGDHNIFVMIDNDDKTPMAYVALNKNSINGFYPINQMENLTGTSGAITSIMGFLVSNLKYKLTFDKNEPLTLSGLQWLLKLLKHNGRGFKIYDQTGKFPDIDEIKDEWDKSMISHNDIGTISFFIENNGIVPGIKENNIIKTPYKILFDTRFL